MKRTIVNPIIKDTVTFLQTSEETNGKMTEAEITLMPGGANPLHYHKTYSETFTPIEGELGVKLGKHNSKILKPGESYTVPPMELHSFFNRTEKEIKFNVRLSPGHTGFENSLRILYGLASDGLTDKNTIPKSIKHTAIIACTSDMNLPGLFTFMFPVLKIIAKRAKTSGEEQKLIDKYCVQTTQYKNNDADLKRRQGNNEITVEDYKRVVDSSSLFLQKYFVLNNYKIGRAKLLVSTPDKQIQEDLKKVILTNLGLAGIVVVTFIIGTNNNACQQSP